MRTAWVWCLLDLELPMEVIRLLGLTQVVLWCLILFCNLPHMVIRSCWPILGGRLTVCQ